MYYRLVRNNSADGAKPQVWNLQLPATVGRGSEASVCIDDESISRVHCKLFLATDESLQVRDQGSTNGTYINGERVQHSHSVSPGDTLQVGSVMLQVLYASDTDPGPIPPKKNNPSAATTQPMRTVSKDQFARVAKPQKQWWEFWKP